MTKCYVICSPDAAIGDISDDEHVTSQFVVYSNFLSSKQVLYIVFICKNQLTQFSYKNKNEAVSGRCQ